MSEHLVHSPHVSDFLWGLERQGLTVIGQFTFVYLVARHFFWKLKMNKQSLNPPTVLRAAVWTLPEPSTVCAVLAGSPV